MAQEIGEMAENLSKMNETRRLYAAISKMNKGYKPKAYRCKDRNGELMENEDVTKRWTIF